MKLLKPFFYVFVLCMLTKHVSAQETKIKITVDNKTVLTATLANNSSAEALVEILKEGPLTISMRDYGNMEKVGPIGTTLPGNDEQITAQPGDLILFQQRALVIYYAPNSWNFTRLGKIDNVSQEELKTILGDGTVSIILELADITTSE